MSDISKLELENAELRDWLSAYKESVAIASAELARLTIERDGIEGQRKATADLLSLCTKERNKTMESFPPVLDACCGGRMMWFNKKDSRCLYVDKRCESFHVGPGPNDFFNVQPDQVCDFSDLPFPDETFAHVVFDPPHVIRKEAKGWLTRKYGVLNGDWKEMLRKGFAECFRVLRTDGVLVFKWSDSNVKVREILALTPVPPLYGHKTTEHTNTHWIAFIKPNNALHVQPGREAGGL